MQNARLTERAAFVGQVDVVPHASARALRVWGQDVSETGMFLQTTQPFRVGETVSLRFDVEHNEVHVRAAEVVWVRPFEPIAVDGALPGIGLRFVSVDPPARAALRRLARVLPAANDTIVDDKSGLPAPRITLPPLTQSILERAQPTASKKRDTQEMISLLPFSELPVISLPPDDPQLSSEANVFAGIPRGPRSVTMGPTSTKKKQTQPMFSRAPQEARDIEHDDHDVDLFVGWTFRRADDAADDRAYASHDAHDAHDASVPSELSLRFDDDGPRTVSPKSFVGEPSILESADAADGDDAGSYSMGSLPPAFAEGTLAIRHLPLADERAVAPTPVTSSARTSRAAKPKRSLTTAVAFLAAGCCAGAVVGVANHQLRIQPPVAPTSIAATPTTPTTTTTPTATLAAVTPPPRSVAEAEGELFVAPKPTPVSTTTTTTPTTATATPPPTTTAAATTQPVEPPLAAIVTVPTPRAPPQALASTTKPTKKEPLLASPGRLEVDLPEGGSVKRVFALSSPSRVVVDFVGARLPQKPLDVDEGGVVQLRFGRPDKNTERAVIVVAGDDKPQAPKAVVEGDRLTVRWSW